MAWAEPPGILPGQGPERRDAIHDLHAAIEWYDRWASKHGLPLQPSLQPDSTPVDVIEATGHPETGDTEALLPSDRDPLDEEYAERAKMLFCHARLDFLNVCRRALANGSAATGEHIRLTMMHVAQAEWWYASRIAGSPADAASLERGDPELMLHQARIMLLEEHIPFLLSLPDRARLYVVDGEAWTPRKSLRRAIWHELYHLRRVEIG